jgi:hypothetical protein
MFGDEIHFLWVDCDPGCKVAKILVTSAALQWSIIRFLRFDKNYGQCTLSASG